MRGLTLRQFASSAVLLGAALLVAGGCGSKDRVAGRATDSTGVARGDSAPANAGAVRSPNASSDPSRFTDGQILARIAGGDSAEVAVAGLAKTKAANADVKAFAAQLVSDHSGSLASVHGLSGEAGVSLETPPGDTTSQATAHAMQRLQGLSGAAFDTAFVNHEIQDHRTNIEDARKMSNAAHETRVRTLVLKSIPVLQQHLDHAQQIAGKLTGKS